jgi:hypothetical protein
MFVRGVMAEEEAVWCAIMAWAARTPVERVCGSGQRLRPVSGRNVSVEQESANAVIECAKDTLRSSILLGSVWACETKYHPIRRKERPQCMIVKLTAIICLQASYRGMELSTNISMETDDGW